jgi:tetratricopeptide (TPR) repeat protein
MARTYMLRSLAIYEMYAEQRLEGLTHQRLGKVLEKRQDFQGAEEEYRTAIALAYDLDDATSTALSHASLAELLIKRNNLPEATVEAQRALDYVHQEQDNQTEGQILLLQAQIQHKQGDFVIADRLFQEALRLLEATEAYELTATAYFRYANLLEERKEVRRSLDAVKKAFEFQLLGTRTPVE